MDGRPAQPGPDAVTPWAERMAGRDGRRWRPRAGPPGTGSVTPLPRRAAATPAPATAVPATAVPAKAVPDSPAAPSLERMSPDTVRLLEVAAVFDGQFSIDDAAEVLGEPVGRVLPAVEEALDAELIVARSEHLAFHSQPARAALLLRMPESIRLALHRQIGTVLLSRNGSAALAAEHLAAGTRLSDHEAMAALGEAARELIPIAPGVAADLALRVLNVTATTDGDHVRRAVTAVDALVAAKRVPEAEGLARATLDLPRPPVDAAARLRLTLSALRYLAGEPAQAVAEADVVLAGYGVSDDLFEAAELARLLGLVAQDDLAQVRAAGETILADVERRRGDVALAAAITSVAWVAWGEGRATAAVGLARAAVRRADRSAGHDQHPRLALASMLTAVGEFDEAAAVLTWVEGEVVRTSDALWEVPPMLLRARLHLAGGRVDDAVTLSRTALRVAEELSTAMLASQACAVLAQAALLGGDLRRAAEYVQRCRATAPPLVRRAWVTPLWIEARVAESEHGPEAAMEVLADRYEPLRTRPMALTEEPWLASWLTRVALSAGEHRHAETVISAAGRLAAENPEVAPIVAAATHARGLLDRDAGALATAAPGYRHPWACGSAWEDAGVANESAGARETARDALGRALTAYQRAGAERDAARLRSRLRGVGIRPYTWARTDRPATGWLSLTETERHVSSIVAEGLTNAQAADRLFLSPHTVDFHLRKIFRKLGIRSRIELTRVVLERAAG
jgi:DNA-binding CsgD family transcriptional regulator